jgi:hypothetical protein
MTGDQNGRELTRGRAGDGSTGATPAGSAAAGATPPAEGPLAGIRRAETVADRTDFEATRAELPEGWEVKPDLVQFGTEPLAETVRFERPATGHRLHLQPTDPSDPAGEVRIYERAGPRVARRVLTTVDSLSAALRVAVNRAHQLSRG